MEHRMLNRSGMPELHLAMAWLAGLLALHPLPGRAQTGGWLDNWESAADAGLEWRMFTETAQWPGQSDDTGVSLVLNGEAYWRGGAIRASIKPFMRLDSMDAERSHFDLREAYVAWEGDRVEVLAGFNKVFWGVAESRHLVDIINQDDGVEDPDREQKLGQPMVRALWQREWGQLEAYWMPWFRERTFPGAGGRLRPPIPVDSDRSLYESGAGEFRSDFALRWSHYFGDLDLGAYVFSGTGREPMLLPTSDGRSLQPVYHSMTQFGLDAQYTRDAWLWKLELIARDGREDDFLAAVAGFEYTVYGVSDSALDLGLLFEVLYDGRGSGEPGTIYDDDLFLGTRLAWNDAADTSLLAGVVVDGDDDEWLLNLEAERRLGERLFAEAKLRLFQGDSGEGALVPFDRDDYLEVRLTWYD